MLRTVPVVGLIPLLIIWFGIGDQPKLILIALGVFFPLYLNLFAGIRGTDPALIEAGRTLGLSRFGLVRTWCCRRRCPTAWSACGTPSASPG